MNNSLRRMLAALALFGISFGCVEAAVVVYLRAILEPARRQFHPTVSRMNIFPLLKLEQLSPELRALLAVELGREFATLLTLAAAGLLVSRTWLAGFAVAFGIWDIAFYGFLKIFINWPESLLTWDLLFLLPVPWCGPVIAPMIVAATMIALGAKYLWKPFPIRGASAMGMLAGSLAVVIAFCRDWKNLMAGGLPNPFPWWIFWIGEALILAVALKPGRR